MFGSQRLLAVAAAAVPAGERFMWVPDSEGNLHMVDLLDVEPEDTPVPFFNGEKDVDLRLYTQNNPSTPEYILQSDPSKSPSFNPANPTRFILHGWTSSHKQMDPIRQAYIDTGKDWNIVLVDWNGPATSEYSISKRNSRRVGEYLAEVILHLEAERGLNLDDVYIIGHSLGGQASGVAGNRLGGRVARIVGLDAAAPLFGTTSLKNRLDPTDAKIVQGIHTNGGLLGWDDPLGHVDFFPNGGSSQSGCILDVTGACSHNRAPPFYAESIINNEFVGTLCHSYKAYKKGNCDHYPQAVMGEWTPAETAGNYYLKTNSKKPYGLGA
ncbi:hypothetical protein R5R35_002727 [Gryllus longicercus]|uniref:Lipase domain-containing protein n=1 Tax=Gryllus longicercus TaxID=2509291 RepID=A0AAN9VHT0_9ORTH